MKRTHSDMLMRCVAANGNDDTKRGEGAERGAARRVEEASDDRHAAAKIMR